MPTMYAPPIGRAFLPRKLEEEVAVVVQVDTGAGSGAGYDKERKEYTRSYIAELYEVLYQRAEGEIRERASRTVAPLVKEPPLRDTGEKTTLHVEVGLPKLKELDFAQLLNSVETIDKLVELYQNQLDIEEEEILLLLAA